MKIGYLKYTLALYLTLFISNSICAQDSTIIFYDLIKEDSVVMYFDNSFNFTEKNCADNKRFTKINGNGNFYQEFIDKDLDNKVLGKGAYEDGIRDGIFETFFPNGQTKSKGKYKANRPIGQWLYYYEDGKPERELLINLADTFLIQFYDKNGDHTVVDGNGFFNGEVATADRFFRNKIIASGKIVNGKPDGEWKSFFGKFPYCTEKFENGKFQFGHHNSVAKGNEKYSDISFLQNFFISSYIQSLEEFRVVKCSTFKVDTTRRFKVNSEINLDQFRSYVKEAIDRSIDMDIKTGNYKDYQPGENLLKISFTVNNEGIPTEFKKLTYWGDQFFDAVTDALRRHAKLPSSTTPIYFILTVNKSEENAVTYRYNFSRE